MYKEVPQSSYISFDYHFNTFSGHVKDQIVSEVFFREKKRQRSLYVWGSDIGTLKHLQACRPVSYTEVKALSLVP